MLEDALEFAGDNRSELERVLSHYSSEPEKLEAAKFLIRNMPHCYSYQGWQLDSIKPVLSYIANTPGIKYMTEEQRRRWSGFSARELHKVYDSHVITSDYLIHNIDQAFRMWKGRPWNRTLNFDDFCEMILPYRIGNEPLSDWRPVYEQRYGRLLDSLYHGTDVIEACKIVNAEIERQGVKYNAQFSLPHIEATFLIDNRVGYCREDCDLGMYAMRACGIPVASDFFIASPDYLNSHQWLVVRDTTGTYIQFGFDSIKPQRSPRLSDGRKKGKVYRSCYGMQADRIEKRNAHNGIPPAMRDVFIKDVTSGYFGKNSISVPVDTKSDDIYLGIFDPKGWKPVDYGMRDGDSAVFRNLEPGVVYQPLVCDTDGQCQPAGYPFLYTFDGTALVLRPNGQSWRKVTLRRKMSLVRIVARRLYEGIIGTRIEASNDAKPGNWTTIHTFRDTLRYCNVKITNSDNNTYRYLRYRVTDGHPINFADIAVYEDSKCHKEVPMRLVTPVASYRNPQQMTDHDMMTAFKGPDGLEAVVFKFGRQARIGCIDFYPHNDANFIMPGDTYELFCQNGAGGWKSLGRKTATASTIEFDAPANALLWLRDITQGREEQVFVYENGRQYFVCDIKKGVSFK